VELREYNYCNNLELPGRTACRSGHLAVRLLFIAAAALLACSCMGPMAHPLIFAGWGQLFAIRKENRGPNIHKRTNWNSVH